MHEDKLIQRMEQGDISAAEELIRIYYPEILQYCAWLTMKEIGAVLGLPMCTIQSKLRSALKTLKKNIQEGDFE